jgi:hypothetical protein
VRFIQGERWRCQNRAYGGEIQVVTSSKAEDGINPRCPCGGIMKKPYHKPVLREHEATAALPGLFKDSN